MKLENKKLTKALNKICTNISNRGIVPPLQPSFQLVFWPTHRMDAFTYQRLVCALFVLGQIFFLLQVLKCFQRSEPLCHHFVLVLVWPTWELLLLMICCKDLQQTVVSRHTCYLIRLKIDKTWNFSIFLKWDFLILDKFKVGMLEVCDHFVSQGCIPDSLLGSK